MFTTNSYSQPISLSLEQSSESAYAAELLAAQVAGEGWRD